MIASVLEPVMPAMTRLSSPDGAITLMLSDIADAEAVAERLGPDRWERLLSDHHILVEKLLALHEGQLLKVEHDGFLAAFSSAHSGLHAAVDMQRTFSDSGAHAETQGLALRGERELDELLVGLLEDRVVGVVADDDIERRRSGERLRVATGHDRR